MIADSLGGDTDKMINLHQQGQVLAPPPSFVFQDDNNSNGENKKMYDNWFETYKKFFIDVLTPLAGKDIKALQIGAYTGDASVWLLENILTSSDSALYDIDNWVGTNEYEESINFSEVEKEYDKRTSHYANLVKIKKTSDEFFENNVEIFDFIYIDGYHHSEYVYRDAENAFKFSKPGTIIAFDDYEWKNKISLEERPKPAIDKFLSKHAESLDILIKDYQVWVRIK